MTKRTKKNAAETPAVVTEMPDMSQFLADIEAQAETLTTDAELLAQLEEAEAAQAPVEAQATEAPAEVIEDEPVVIAHVPGVVKDLIANVPADASATKQKEIVAEFASRVAFEKAQPSLSAKMLPNLEAAEKKMATIGTAAIFCALDIDPGFINREISTGSKFNVYGLQKVNDLVTGIGAGILQNAVNRAVLASMFNFRKAGVAFTGEAALAAVSDKIKVDTAIRKHLVRHTVSANTASTQKSSTMNALEVMGIVTSNKLRGTAEVFTLTDTPQTRRLEEMLLAA